MSQAADVPLLTYSAGAAGVLPPRRWWQLLWLGVVHLVVMVGLVGISVPGILALSQTLVREPWADWFVMGLFAHTVSIPLMLLVNGLAVAGYVTAVRGRSPRRWFILYVPTQLALMVLQYALLVVLAVNSPHQTSSTSSFGVSAIGLLLMPIAHFILNLPLFLLLFPRIRRACFAR